MRAISRSVVGLFDHVALRRLCDQNPRLAATLWKVTLVDGAVFWEWVVNVGQRQALNRVAHLFCEIMARMEHVGLARDGECEFALSQTELGEAVGLSTVHVNRTLQGLRATGMMSYDSERLAIHDRSGLCRLGDFQPNYLHLVAAQANDELSIGTCREC